VNKYKAILFDFDGTIADTFAVAVPIFNELSREFHYRSVSEEEIPSARKMSAREIMKAFGIPVKSVPALAQKGLRMLHAKMEEISPFDGISELLHSLKQPSLALGILSSNSSDNVGLFLRKHDLEVFDFVRCSSRLFGKAKEIRKILKENGWKKHEVLMIGDECRDIEAAQKAGIPVVAVAWGFNSREALELLNPDALVSSPSELSEFLLR